MPAEFRMRAIGGLVLVILPVPGFLAMFPAPGGLIFATVRTWQVLPSTRGCAMTRVRVSREPFITRYLRSGRHHFS